MTKAKGDRRTPAPSSVPDREKGFYWLKDHKGAWEPYGFWNGACWSFPWSAADYNDDEVGEIGPICRVPAELAGAT